MDLRRQTARRPFRGLATAASVALMAATLAACGSSDSGNSSSTGDATSRGANVDSGRWGAVINTGGRPVRGGILRVNQDDAPAGISPLYLLTDPRNDTIQVVMQVFDQLTELRPGSIDPQPGLAESWEVSPDGKTYTFRLRDAKFSDGAPVTSGDVRYSLDRVRARGSFYVDLYASIATIETPDPSTVVLRLKQPTPAMLSYLSFAGASVVPERLVRADERGFNRRPIGSGPFVVRSWKPDQAIELTRNDSYWQRGLPYLDGAVLTSVPDDNTRVLNVQSGEAQVADFVPFAQIDAIDKAGKARVLIGPGADTTAIWVNNSRRPYDEREVRQALMYATPVESIIDVVFHGKSPQANTIIPKLEYWTDQARAYPYDLERARELLTRSSVPDGFTATIQINADDQAASQIVQILEQAWARIGVRLVRDQADAATVAEKFYGGRYELNLVRPGAFTSDVPVDDQFAELQFNSPATGNLFTFSRPAQARDYARRAVVETDQQKRRELFAQMHVASMEELPTLPLVYTPNRAAVANEVRDFNYMLTGYWRLESAWLEQP
ncbi:ABC transporter substrate-binding protein [Conexibacter woesei]|uniref:Extracellular solute-binding protein family 5 n=1 Tax=Conexibacter woesei (strain DSM 14684 / CCUG 47730 / CIP 108061 / JCM 11494 / NBRC 100937 / ID131577) TaxID=469383 RepID=D3FDA5_CONWI|nr:ABC transporter substrate-binding protein [Conexibacter woesei]ADB53497.1 extracellular solute-binding protein family 5 [Conexibacter woesei DSM 14684]